MKQAVKIAGTASARLVGRTPIVYLPTRSVFRDRAVAAHAPFPEL